MIKRAHFQKAGTLEHDSSIELDNFAASSHSARRFSSFAFFANFQEYEYRGIIILEDYKELPLMQQTALLNSTVHGRLFVTNDTFSVILMRTPLFCLLLLLLLHQL